MSKLTLPEAVFTKLHLSAITDGANTRTHSGLDEQSIRELAGSIKTMGLMTPISVVDTGNGTYRCLAGHRRRLALAMLGHQTVDALVYPTLSAEQEAIVVTATNTGVGLDPVEEIGMVREHHVKMGMTAARIATTLGMPKGRAEMRIKHATKLDESVIAAMRPGDVDKFGNRAPAIVGDTIATEIASRIPVERQAEFLRRMVETDSFSVRAVRTLAKGFLEPVTVPAPVSDDAGDEGDDDTPEETPKPTLNTQAVRKAEWTGLLRELVSLADDANTSTKAALVDKLATLATNASAVLERA